jgi:plastocyanin
MTVTRMISIAALAGALSCSNNSGSNLMTPSTPSTPPATPLPAGSANVTIQDFTFSPAMVTIKVGAAVQWTNNGPSSHTTTSDNGVWDSGVLPAGATFQTTFSKTGTYGYHCTIHPPSIYPKFVGTVVVPLLGGLLGRNADV